MSAGKGTRFSIGDRVMPNHASQKASGWRRHASQHVSATSPTITRFAGRNQTGTALKESSASGVVINCAAMLTETSDQK